MQYNDMLIINSSSSEVLLGLFLIITLFIMIYTVGSGILTIKRIRILKEARQCAITGLTIRKNAEPVCITTDNEQMSKAGEADKDYDFF